MKKYFFILLLLNIACQAQEKVIEGKWLKVSYYVPEGMLMCTFISEDTLEILTGDGESSVHYYSFTSPTNDVQVGEFKYKFVLNNIQEPAIILYGDTISLLRYEEVFDKVRYDLPKLSNGGFIFNKLESLDVSLPEIYFFDENHAGYILTSQADNIDKPVYFVWNKVSSEGSNYLVNIRPNINYVLYIDLIDSTNANISFYAESSDKLVKGKYRLQTFEPALPNLQGVWSSIDADKPLRLEFKEDVCVVSEEDRIYEMYWRYDIETKKIKLFDDYTILYVTVSNTGKNTIELFSEELNQIYIMTHSN